MKNYVVFDVETQNSFREVNNDTKKLKVSVVVAYEYETQKMHHFTEKNIAGLFKLFENSSLIIGFNSKSFDLVVLSPYYVGNLSQFTHFDILENIKETTGRRYPLDDLVQATLGKGKSGHGLQAIEFYRQGKITELLQYCQDDVQLTKELFDFGVNNGHVFAPSSPTNKIKITVDWAKIVSEKTKTQASHNFTLGF